MLPGWLPELAAAPDTSLFPTRQGGKLSRDAVEQRIALYQGRAATQCPSQRETIVTAHVLRHTAAMRLLRAGVDTSVIAFWLGHASVETIQIYLHADLTMKERVLARTQPDRSQPSRYRPSDRLLARFTELCLCRPANGATLRPSGFLRLHRHNTDICIRSFLPTSA